LDSYGNSYLTRVHPGSVEYMRPRKEQILISNYFEKDEKDFPRELMLMKAKCVRKTIRAIEASTDYPELIRIE